MGALTIGFPIAEKNICLCVGEKRKTFCRFLWKYVCFFFAPLNCNQSRQLTKPCWDRQGCSCGPSWVVMSWLSWSGLGCIFYGLPLQRRCHWQVHMLEEETLLLLILPPRRCLCLCLCLPLRSDHKGLFSTYPCPDPVSRFPFSISRLPMIAFSALVCGYPALSPVDNSLAGLFFSK